jgi:hypothetical protein
VSPERRFPPPWSVEKLESLALWSSTTAARRLPMFISRRSRGGDQQRNYCAWLRGSDRPPHACTTNLIQNAVDALHEQVMDFASFVEGDLPQRLISGLWQIDARMLDVGWRPAASGLRWDASSARRGSARRRFTIQRSPVASVRQRYALVRGRRKTAALYQLSRFGKRKSRGWPRAPRSSGRACGRR